MTLCIHDMQGYAKLKLSVYLEDSLFAAVGEREHHQCTQIHHLRRAE